MFGLPYHLPDKDLRKREKFLLKCKEVIWKRWFSEYVRSFREQHRGAGGKQTSYPSVGNVIIRDEKKPLTIGNWQLSPTSSRGEMTLSELLNSGQTSTTSSVQFNTYTLWN